MQTKDLNPPAKNRLGVKKSQFGEGLLGLSVLVAINLVWFRENLGFFGIHPHPYWIVVLPIAIRYGFRGGLWIGFLAAVTMVIMVRLGLPDMDLSEFLVIKYFGIPLLFILAGIVVGETREIQKRRYEDLEEEFNVMKKAYDNLNARYKALEDAKHEIDSRIVSQEHTLSTLYDAAQALKSLKEEDIYPAVLDLLKDFISVEAASLYTLKCDELRLTASLGELRNASRASAVDSYEGVMGKAISKGEVVSINTFVGSEEFDTYAGSEIILSAPLLNGGRTVGVLNIEKLPFMKFNPGTVRMTALVADWCSAAIVNARTYKETKDKNISDEITGTYTYRYFKERFSEEFYRAKRYKLHLSLLAVEVTDFALFSDRVKKEIRPILSEVLKNQLRTIDLICQSEDPSRHILILPNTPGTGALVVKERIIREMKAFKFRPYEGRKTPLQVKVGAAEITGKMKTPDELIQEAFMEINDAQQ